MANKIASSHASERVGKSQTPSVQEVIPAAQYVRMSDESQRYSLENQKAAIQEYASRHGFAVIKTYADRGKSGVVAKRRKGLAQLLQDVVAGKPAYKAILVYDVSRWGRFPNNDEAAHYEFLCFNSGIPLHYCAEPFNNDGTAMSALLKALKRSMAAEFSRELSEKEFRGKSLLAELGFWVGGLPPYGYRRLMISAGGSPKRALDRGEQKSLKTDRVVLTPGPPDQVECVRLIFSMALEGESCRSIACKLNERGITHFGRPWLHGAVYQILKNPLFAGCNVWNRTSTRMRTTLRKIPSQEWITKPHAFQPLIDQTTFDRVQMILPLSPQRISNGVILKKVRRLLQIKGYLSGELLNNAGGLPSLRSLKDRFGTCRELYRKVGYKISAFQELRSERLTRSIRLRRALMEQITNLFPSHVTVSRLPNQKRSVLVVDAQFVVSVLFCSPIKRRGKYVWFVEPNPAEKNSITLLCPVKRSHDRVLAYFVFPRLNGFSTHCMFRNDPFLKEAVRLRELSQFYSIVKAIRTENLGDLCLQTPSNLCLQPAKPSSP
ncbi:MAG TPA: recombinase family protein [Candidatus Binatia bacterium]|nr:recombinase family protein [Candidatus Binatia bacterium]